MFVEFAFQYFNFKLVEIKSVLKQLRQLKANKAAGLDNIPGCLLKAASETIAPSLTYSISTTYPSQWVYFLMTGRLLKLVTTV